MILGPKVKQHTGKVGGIFYFFSLLSVILLAALSSRFFLQFYFSSAMPTQISALQYLFFIIPGFILAALIPGKLSVFIHELKHSLVSSLAGNKSKGMAYKDNTGHFEYTYTSKTAHLNAFISLAPYILPVFSALMLAAYFYFYKSNYLLASILLLLGLGIDLYLNFKDAGIHQTDLTEIRGGYMLSMLYVFSFNIAWVSLISLIVFFGPAVLLEFVSWLASNVLLIIRPETELSIVAYSSRCVLLRDFPST